MESRNLRLSACHRCGLHFKPRALQPLPPVFALTSHDSPSHRNASAVQENFQQPFHYLEETLTDVPHVTARCVSQVLEHCLPQPNFLVCSSQHPSRTKVPGGWRHSVRAPGQEAPNFVAARHSICCRFPGQNGIPSTTNAYIQPWTSSSSLACLKLLPFAPQTPALLNACTVAVLTHGFSACRLT